MCRLLVNMTQPAVICFGKVPTEKMERNQFLEVMSHLQSYKEVLYSVFSLLIIYHKFTSLLSVTSFIALLEIAHLVATVGRACLKFFCVRNLLSYCNSIDYCSVSMPNKYTVQLYKKIHCTAVC